MLKQLSCINEGDGRRSKRKRGASQEGEPDASDGRNSVLQARSIEATAAQAAVNHPAGKALSPGSILSQPSTEGGAVEDASPNSANFRAVPYAQTVRQVKAGGMGVALMAVTAKLESILGRYLFGGMKASRMRRQEEDMGRMTFTDAVHLRLAYQPGEDFVLEVWLCSPIGNAISEVRSVEDLRDMLGDYLFAAMEASNRRKEEKRSGMLTCTSAINVSFPSGKDSDEDSKLEIVFNFETGRNVYAEAYLS